MPTRSTIALQDYRDENGIFDRITSIEMFEAVGEEFWPGFFSQMRDRLQPGGTAGLQVITIQDSLFQTYRRDGRFHPALRFPRRHAAVTAIMKTLGEGMASRDARTHFPHDYATRSRMARNFRAAWPRLTPLGFDDRFRRLWEYYLPIAKPASGPATSTCARSCSQSRIDGALILSNRVTRHRLVRPAAVH